MGSSEGHEGRQGALLAAQPIALVVLGVRLRHDRPHLGRVLLTTGAVTGASAVLFVLFGDGPVSGALERLALRPVLVGLAAFAWTQLSGRERPTKR